ncbi:MAG: site-specific integrase [Oscillospiraceae bacterium]|nr:site-specific integrase [Oscillospiraceae bacterium]
MNIQERRNKDGKITSYRVRVFDHRDSATGKQVFKTFSIKYDPAKSETWNRKNAEKQGAVFEKSLEEQNASVSSVTFDNYADYVIKLKAHTKRIAKSTALIQRYKQRRASPFIGHIQLKNLTPNTLNKAYSAMLETGVSVKTVYELHRFIHGVLAVALKEGIIPRNYASSATPPKNERTNISAITEDELKAFFAAIYAEKRNYVYQVFFSLLLATGCRIGELCALTWDNVDFGQGRIRICRHFVQDETGQCVEEGCKTVAGERWLYLDDSVMKMLAEYRVYYLKKAREYGTKWDYSINPVFSAKRNLGNYLSPHSVREWLRGFLKRKELPHIRPHQFRHTSISLLLQAGISIPDAAKRAGHCRPDITLSIYSHTLKNNDKHCCEAVMRAIPALPDAPNLPHTKS